VERLGERGRVEGHRGVTGHRQLRVLLGGQRADRRLEATGGDARLVVVHRERHRAGLQRPHDLGGDPGRQHRHAVLGTVDLHRDGDPELDVGAGDLETGTAQLQADTGQDRQRPTPTGRGTAGRGQCVDEHITFAPELHAVPTSSAVFWDIRTWLLL